MTSIKGRNSVMHRSKWQLNNPKVDIVNMNAYTTFWPENPLIRSQYIERIRKPDITQEP